LRMMGGRESLRWGLRRRSRPWFRELLGDPLRKKGGGSDRGVRGVVEVDECIDGVVWEYCSELVSHLGKIKMLR
jgi:hypothetical protein